jgi:predicted transcriptional regulator
MPNQPRPDNPSRNVRVEDALWDAAKALAHANGTTLSAVIRKALVAYVKRHATREK